MVQTAAAAAPEQSQKEAVISWISYPLFIRIQTPKITISSAMSLTTFTLEISQNL